jgi:hypothetical protein
MGCGTSKARHPSAQQAQSKAPLPPDLFLYSEASFGLHIFSSVLFFAARSRRGTNSTLSLCRAKNSSFIRRLSVSTPSTIPPIRSTYLYFGESSNPPTVKRLSLCGAESGPSGGGLFLIRQITSLPSRDTFHNVGTTHGRSFLCLFL